MSFTLWEVYKNHYLQKCTTERKMSFQSFANLKPDNMRTIQQTPLRGCKCEYCQNFGIVREELIAMGLKGIPRNQACAIEMTWYLFRKQITLIITYPNSNRNSKDSEKCHENLSPIEEIGEASDEKS